MSLSRKSAPSSYAHRNEVLVFSWFNLYWLGPNNTCSRSGSCCALSLVDLRRLKQPNAFIFCANTGMHTIWYCTSLVRNCILDWFQP